MGHLLVQKRNLLAWKLKDFFSYLIWTRDKLKDIAYYTADRLMRKEKISQH